MSVWSKYPKHYRSREVNHILQAVCAGECVEIVGLSGSGKSNLLGFLAHRITSPGDCTSFVMVDCNLLTEPSQQDFYHLVIESLEKGSSQEKSYSSPKDQLAFLGGTVKSYLENNNGLCLLFDRFDALIEEQAYIPITSNLRAIRDAHKYRLTYVVATRTPLDSGSELAELFFGNTLWLGPLSKEDALWSAKRDAERFSLSGREWNQETFEQLADISWGYPSLLRAVCEAYAKGASLEEDSLRGHPAVTRRVAEFWSDSPGEEALRLSRLLDHPLLGNLPVLPLSQYGGLEFDASQLTSKEHLLLKYFLENSGKVCEKDELVGAVWSEDVIYEQGIRDESLAQLVRRLRVKIEPDPSNPRYIKTIPGRGYIFTD